MVEALARRPQDLADTARYLVRYTVENPGTRSEFATYEGSADFRSQRFLAQGGGLPEAGSVDEAEYFVFAQWQYSGRKTTLDGAGDSSSPKTPVRRRRS